MRTIGSIWYAACTLPASSLDPITYYDEAVPNSTVDSTPSTTKGQGKCGGEVGENLGISFVAAIPVKTVGECRSLAISPRERKI